MHDRSLNFMIEICNEAKLMLKFVSRLGIT